MRLGMITRRCTGRVFGRENRLFLDRRNFRNPSSGVNTTAGMHRMIRTIVGKTVVRHQQPRLVQVVRKEDLALGHRSQDHQEDDLRRRNMPRNSPLRRLLVSYCGPSGQ